MAEPTETPLSPDAFAAHVESLLDGHDSVEVTASSLTDFPWQLLCFERHDALRLRFQAAGGDRLLSLPYERFFVDEGHVANSLEDECISPGDRIVVKKKYPGYEGPIEFQKATQGG